MKLNFAFQLADVVWKFFCKKCPRHVFLKKNHHKCFRNSVLCYIWNFFILHTMLLFN